MDILIKLLFFLFLIPSLLFAEDGSTINGSLTVENNVTADYYLGNGSLLDGISTTETDPWYNISVAFGITSTMRDNWNTSYSWGNHSLGGYMPWVTFNGTA